MTKRNFDYYCGLFITSSDNFRNASILLLEISVIWKVYCEALKTLNLQRRWNICVALTHRKPHYVLYLCLRYELFISIHLRGYLSRAKNLHSYLRRKLRNKVELQIGEILFFWISPDLWKMSINRKVVEQLKEYSWINSNLFSMQLRYRLTIDLQNTYYMNMYMATAKHMNACDEAQTYIYTHKYRTNYYFNR